jgi:cyclin-dependent kinase-like
MTDYVATRWYRAPELLLGQNYSTQVDVWAVACIWVEMLEGAPLFPGESDFDQLWLIQKAVGPLSKKQRFYFDINPNYKGMAFPSYAE